MIWCFFDGLTLHDIPSLFLNKSWTMGGNFQLLPEGSPLPWSRRVGEGAVVTMDDLYAKESGHLSLAGSSSTVERLHELKIKMAVEAMSPVTRTIWRNRMGRVGEAGVEEDAEASSLIQILATVGEIQRVWTGQTGLLITLVFGRVRTRCKHEEICTSATSAVSSRQTMKKPAA